jgi:lysine-N-methylase
VHSNSRHIQPRFYDDFRCIGADCSDTCCSGWKLPVDKESHRKYGLCEDPLMGPLFKSLVVLQPAGTADSHYAEFQLLDASCGFLSEGLCSIQSKLGEGYLANACATFPRTENLVDGVRERSLDLSCPESARLALLDPSPLEFVEGAGNDALAGNPGAISSASTAPEEAAGVRRLVIWLLQNRKYPLSQRLILVGHVCDRLQRMADKGGVGSNGVASDKDVVKGFQTAVGLGLFDNHLHEIPARPATQLGVTLKLIAERLTGDYASPKFHRLFDEFKQGLGWTAGSTFDELGQLYVQQYAEHYLPFMSRHEYLLEHYLVTYAFRTLFPYGTAASLQALGGVRQTICAQYSLMVAFFAMLKTILIGLAGLHRSAFSPAHVAHVVQVGTKTFEHAAPFRLRILQMLAAWGLKTTASMAVLVCN